MVLNEFGLAMTDSNAEALTDDFGLETIFSGEWEDRSVDSTLYALEALIDELNRSYIESGSTDYALQVRTGLNPFQGENEVYVPVSITRVATGEIVLQLNVGVDTGRLYKSETDLTRVTEAELALFSIIAFNLPKFLT